jgi:hypothetical protein
MKKLVIIVCFILAADFASAQNQLGESARDVAQRNSKLVRTELGLVPRNLKDLVEASPVIVRGTYGPLLATRLDLGEGRNLEQLVQQLKLPVEQVEQMGFPMATYQFNISEVLKDSNLLDDDDPYLEFEFAESEDALDVLPWLSEHRAGEHLLFLDVASNGTLYIRGQVFDMKLQDGKYIFRFGEDSKESTGFGSENAQAFLRSIDQLVE